MGLDVGQWRKFKTNCEAMLRRVLQQRHLGLSCEGGYTKKRCCLTGQAAVDHATNDLPLIPFSNLGDLDIWVGVSIDTETEGAQTYVQHVSMQLRVGGATDPGKILWMRAEWDSRRGPATHAQPHWQFVADDRILPNGGAASQFADADLLPNGNQLLAGDAQLTGAFPRVRSIEHVEPSWRSLLDHFHYAMATDWHVRNPSKNWRVPTDDEELLRWMDRCLGYVREQLDYCNNRTGATAREGV